MEKVTFCIPSKNNLRYLKWCIKSIRDNAYRKDHDIIVFVDKDTDGTIDWLKKNSKIFNVEYIVNPDLNNSLYGIGKSYDSCISKSNTEICVVFHADMYLCKNADLKMFNHLKQNSVVCATRIEPPLHPPGPEKIVYDFGLWPETDVEDGFREKELNQYVSQIESEFQNQTTNGCFAPWMIYKNKMIEIGGHDSVMKSAREDSDIFNRFVLSGMELIQSRDSFVYHLTCRGGQFEHGILSKNHSEKSEDWQKLMEESTWDYVRKWNKFVMHDKYMMPILNKKYDVGLFIDTDLIENDIQLLQIIEPWVVNLYLNNENSVTELISLLQPKSSYDMSKRIVYVNSQNSDEIKNDIVLVLKNKGFSQNDFNAILGITEIISKETPIGKYQIENLEVDIRDINDINEKNIYQNNILFN